MLLYKRVKMPGFQIVNKDKTIIIILKMDAVLLKISESRGNFVIALD